MTSKTENLAAYDLLQFGYLTAGFRTPTLGGDPALEITDADAPEGCDFICLSVAEARALREWLNGVLGAPETSGDAELRKYIHEQLGFLEGDDDNKPAEALLRIAASQLKTVADVSQASNLVSVPLDLLNRLAFEHRDTSKFERARAELQHLLFHATPVETPAEQKYSEKDVAAITAAIDAAREAKSVTGVCVGGRASLEGNDIMLLKVPSGSYGIGVRYAIRAVKTNGEPV